MSEHHLLCKYDDTIDATKHNWTIEKRNGEIPKGAILSVYIYIKNPNSAKVEFIINGY